MKGKQVNFFFVLFYVWVLLGLLHLSNWSFQNFYVRKKKLSCSDFSLVCIGFQPNPHALYEKHLLIYLLQDILQCPVENASVIFDVKELNELNQKRQVAENKMSQLLFKKMWENQSEDRIENAEAQDDFQIRKRSREIGSLRNSVNREETEQNPKVMITRDQTLAPEGIDMDVEIWSDETETQNQNKADDSMEGNKQPTNMPESPGSGNKDEEVANPDSFQSTEPKETQEIGQVSDLKIQEAKEAIPSQPTGLVLSDLIHSGVYSINGAPRAVSFGSENSEQEDGIFAELTESLKESIEAGNSKENCSDGSEMSSSSTNKGKKISKKIWRLKEALKKLETRIFELNLKFHNRDISTYQGVIFITFSKQSDAKKVILKARKFRNFRILRWFLLVLTLGKVHLKSGLSEKQEEFFQEVTLLEGIDPKEVNWNYKRYNFIYFLVFSVIYGFEIFIYCVTTIFYEHLYKAIISLVDVESQYALLYLPLLVLYCLLNLIYVLTGFTLAFLKDFFFDKSRRETFQLLNYVLLQTLWCYTLYWSQIPKSFGCNGAVDKYNACIDSFFNLTTILTFLTNPIYRQINFNFFEKKTQQSLIRLFPKKFTQKDANIAFQPVKHDTALSLAYIQLLLIRYPIVSVTSPGLSIVFLVACIFNFWCEKFLMLRFFKKTTRFSFALLEKSFLFSLFLSAISLLFFHPTLILSLIAECQKNNDVVHKLRPVLENGWVLVTFLLFYLSLAIYLLILVWVYFFFKTKRRMQQLIWNRIQKEKGLSGTEGPKEKSLLEMDYKELKEYFELEYDTLCPFDQLNLNNESPL